MPKYFKFMVVGFALVVLGCLTLVVNYLFKVGHLFEISGLIEIILGCASYTTGITIW